MAMAEWKLIKRRNYEALRPITRADGFGGSRVLRIQEGQRFFRLGPRVSTHDREAVGVALLDEKLSRVVPELADGLLTITNAEKLRIRQKQLLTRDCGAIQVRVRDLIRKRIAHRGTNVLRSCLVRPVASSRGVRHRLTN